VAAKFVKCPKSYYTEQFEKYGYIRDKYDTTYNTPTPYDPSLVETVACCLQRDVIKRKPNKHHVCSLHVPVQIHVFLCFSVWCMLPAMGRLRKGIPTNAKSDFYIHVIPSFLFLFNSVIWVERRNSQGNDAQALFWKLWLNTTLLFPPMLAISTSHHTTIAAQLFIFNFIRFEGKVLARNKMEKRK